MVALIALSLLAAAQQDVVIPFHLAEDAIIIDATVNGRKMSLMFDTGFSGAVIAEGSFDLGPATGTMELRDFVGAFTAKTVKIKSLMLGDAKVDCTDMDAVLQPPNRNSFVYNAHTDGVLGFQAIQNHVTEINFEKHVMIFHPDSYDITKLKPDNKKTFLSRMLPLGHSAMVLDVSTKDGQHLNLSLDTGNSFYGTTYRDTLERVGLWDSKREPKYQSIASVASGEVDTWIRKLSDMTVFGVPVQTSYWDIINLPSSTAESDGTVGIRFLQNFNVTIDYQRRRVWFDEFSGRSGNDPDGQVGVYAGYDRSRSGIRIVLVQDESPASKAGIQKDDIILSIDGNEILGQPTGRQMEALLRGKIGSKVTLGISHQGDFKKIELVREALVNE